MHGGSWCTLITPGAVAVAAVAVAAVIRVVPSSLRSEELRGVEAVLAIALAVAIALTMAVVLTLAVALTIALTVARNRGASMKITIMMVMIVKVRTSSSLRGVVVGIAAATRTIGLVVVRKVVGTISIGVLVLRGVPAVPALPSIIGIVTAEIELPALAGVPSGSSRDVITGGGGVGSRGRRGGGLHRRSSRQTARTACHGSTGARVGAIGRVAFATGARCSSCRHEIKLVKLEDDEKRKKKEVKEKVSGI